MYPLTEANQLVGKLEENYLKMKLKTEQSWKKTVIFIKELSFKGVESVGDWLANTSMFVLFLTGIF